MRMGGPPFFVRFATGRSASSWTPVVGSASIVMCLCCVGWGLFLFNYMNGRAGQPTVDDIKPTQQILAGQALVAGLDYFFWTELVGFTGASLRAVILIFDVLPLVAQAAFVWYVMTNATVAPVAARPCCDGEAARSEKELMLQQRPSCCAGTKDVV